MNFPRLAAKMAWGHLQLITPHYLDIPEAQVGRPMWKSDHTAGPASHMIRYIPDSL